jgi:DNA-binding CsgD family transcriptional regulator
LDRQEIYAIARDVTRQKHLELQILAASEHEQQRISGEPPLAAQGMNALSDRELEVFRLIGEGFTSREISARLHLGGTTVDSYRARIKQKLALKNSTELYQRAALWVAGPGT